MSLKRYHNELILVFGILFLLLGWGYKHYQLSSQKEDAATFSKSINAFREIVALQKIWGNKDIAKRVDKLQTTVPASKVKWSKSGKKLTAVFDNLTAGEMNSLVNKLMNLAVEIEKLQISHSGTVYHVECACKW
ncbi:MAG: hypothetical protein IE885_08605 [Campylobacterales bacterium]|nr:hypothetical protein [Campylobacterales bacterium]